MSVWGFLEQLFSSFVAALSPVFEYEFGGFTYWQYSLFAFLICSFVRFVLPLVSGGTVGSSGVISSVADDVKSIQKGDSQQSLAYRNKGVFKG